MLRPETKCLASCCIAFAVLTFAGLADAAGPLPAFPGAQGYGALTPGGRGGQILRVTTLAPSGPGSFVEAVRTPGPRIIVFEVGGIIDLGGKSLAITEPFLTIAGQTAPAPGITFIKGAWNIQTHDVIVQHVRIRPGDCGRAKKSGWEPDGITTAGAANVIIDHCSCTWAVDENLSASGARFNGNTPEEWRRGTSHHITFSNCIIAEGLSNSSHAKGEHSKGTLIHDNVTDMAVIGNLYASNADRNPMAKAGAHAVIVNNWISNPGRYAMSACGSQSEWGEREILPACLVIVGNLLEMGPSTAASLTFMACRSPTAAQLYMEDNLFFDRQGKPVEVQVKGLHTKCEKKPFWPDGLTALPADKVKDSVAKNVGARPWDRDAVDRRILQAAMDGKGKIIDSQDEVGGYPTVPATRAPFNPSDWDLDTLQPRKAQP